MAVGRDDFSHRRCIDFTEAIAHNAGVMGVTTQEMLFVLAEMTSCFVIKKGMNIEQVLKTFKEIHDDMKQTNGRIIKP